MPAKKNVRTLHTMTEVVQCVQFTGSHFFDKDTMRYFGSRLLPDVYETKFGTLFITSERDSPWYSSRGTELGAWQSTRRYTVRFVACRTVRAVQLWGDPATSCEYTQHRGDLIDTSKDNFGRFATLRTARKFASQQRERINGLRIKDNPVIFPLDKILAEFEPIDSARIPEGEYGS
jgi:hypothetical protein